MKKIVLILAAVTSLGSTSAFAAKYLTDPTHTFLTFEIDHRGASTIRVRIDNISADVEFDQAAKTGSVVATVDTSSVNSGTASFDNHLKADDIFNTEKYPNARFVSDKFVFDGDKVKEVPGQLTLLGVTKPITLNATKFGCYKKGELEVCGGDFEAVMDRTQWDVNFGIDWGAAKEVKLVIQFEATKVK